MPDITIKDIAKMIDHSLLHPTFTDEVIKEGCKLAVEYDVATACVKPYAIPMVKELLAGSNVGICPVIGFPHGNSSTAIKVQEAEAAVLAGGDEIDMVVNVGKVLGGDWDYVSAEIKAINDAVVGNGAILKVIFETDFLDDSHIVQLCDICSQHAVAFVKTSTGYGFVKQENGLYSYEGATEHNLTLMRNNVDPGVQVKASGGVRTLDDILKVRELGATRVGATATAVILAEARERGIE